MRGLLLVLMPWVLISLCHAQQINRIGHGASAASGAQQGSAVPPSSPPASAALAIQDSLKRIAAAQEAQAASGKTDAEKQRETADLQAQQDMAYWAKAMFFATMVSAAVSVFATWLLFLTLKQSRRAAYASLRAAVAGRQSVKVSRDSAEKQLRAYVSVNHVKVEWSIEPDDVTIKRVGISVDLKNDGQTPAHRVTSWIFARSMPPNANDFTADLGSDIDPSGVLGPGVAAQLACVPQFEDLTNGVVGGWRKGSTSLFVFGEVRYFDSFGKERLTAFRFFMPPDGVSVGRGEFKPCSDGNIAT